MNENGRKKREWVKTAAIVFLSVMLVLTFFSSTIQNWSLPEVATQYVQSGTITAKVLVTGTVASVDPYEVKVTESRKVASVAVRRGDTVKQGDVLVYLEDKDSTELENAKKTLDKAWADYRKAILSDKYTAGDISEADKGVTAEVYRKQIDRAQATVKAAEGAVKAAEDAVKAAETAIKTGEQAEKDVTEPNEAELKRIDQLIQDYEKQIEYNEAINANSSRKFSEAESDKNNADRELSTATSELEQTVKSMKAAREKLEDKEDETARIEENRDRIQKVLEDAEKAYSDAVLYYNGKVDELEKIYKNPAASATDRENAEKEQSAAKARMDKAESDMKLAKENYEAVKVEAEKSVSEREKLRRAFWETEAAYTDAEENYYDCLAELQKAEKVYEELEKPRKQREENILMWKDEIAGLNVYKYEYQKAAAEHGDSAKEITEKLKEQLDIKKEELEASKKVLEEKKDALADLVSRADNVTALQGYLDAIDEAQKNVDELAAKAGGTTITAPIAGTISSINVTAGNETSVSTPVVVMQREGQGFTIDHSVTNEVAKRLSVGDVGALSNPWRYNDVTVTLASIKPDPDSRGQNKLLTFNVTGSVVAGESLSFSVGQKSSNYNFIVPNSAVREDNNGKFILIVTSKGSPLGTRYMASRVDVEVIASDETQSAVSGALAGYEFVITTSTKPVEAGNLVRLPD